MGLGAVSCCFFIICGVSLVLGACGCLLSLCRLVGFLVSTVVITIFGEILPQAVCARHGLRVGGNLAWFVWALEWLLYPVVKPIAAALNCLLGRARAETLCCPLLAGPLVACHPRYSGPSSRCFLLSDAHAQRQRAPLVLHMPTPCVCVCGCLYRGGLGHYL